jgi:alpha-ribazole phosphatase
MELFLIRHTPVDVPAGVCYGSTDVPVRASFGRDAAGTASVLENLCPDRVDHWITSPASRCRVLTANLLEARGHSADVAQHDARWWEMDFGSWEMKRWSEIPRSTVDAWLADYVVNRPAGGETFGEVAFRTWKAMAALGALPPDARVAVVAHGGSIRAALAQVLQMPLRAAFRLQVDHGSVTHVRLSERRPELHVMNRLAHR